MTALLGIDLGTSSVKTILVDRDNLSILAESSQEYRVLHPQSGYAEQNPDDWWDAVVHTVRDVLRQHPTEIAAIGVDGQMHGTVMLDQAGTWVHPAIIWADTRAVEQVQRLTQQIQESPEQFAHISGLPAAGFMAVTLMWLAEHQPDILAQTHKIILPKDALRYKLTGTIGTDFSDASATWLMDARTKTWSASLLESLGVDPEKMPHIDPSEEVIGAVSSVAASELGIAQGIPVVAGCADLPAQALGHGIVSVGMGLVTVGSGGQVFVPLADPILDEQNRYYTFHHNVSDVWYAQAAILSAGLALRWLRDTLGMRDVPNAFEELSSLAGDVALGANQLLFLPYLSGERTPHMNPLASAMFFGLRLHHTRGHLARAVMEGVAFALKSCVELIADDLQSVLLSGGAAQSPIWRQIIADVLGKPLVLPQAMPYGAIGSAILAGVGAGEYGSFTDAVDRLPQSDPQIDPIAANVTRYQAYYEQYQQLYPKLKDNMAALSQLG
jgi:xylulokinase